MTDIIEKIFYEKHQIEMLKKDIITYRKEIREIERAVRGAEKLIKKHGQQVATLQKEITIK